MSGGDYIVVNNVFLDSAQSIRFGGNTAVPDTVFINSSINLTKNLSLNRINADGSIGLTNVNAVNVIVASSFLNQLNTIFDGANSSFNQTNTEFGIINLHYTVSNTAYSQANLVYGVINIAFTTANANLSNIYNTYNKAVAAYNQANITIPLFIATNAAFDTANALNVSTNNAYNSANAENIAAFVFNTQNIYSDLSNTVVHLRANNSYNTANFANISLSAFASINVTNTVASNAYIRANVAMANLNYVNTAIRTAFDRVNANSVAISTAYTEANNNYKIDVLLSNAPTGTGGDYIINNTVITKPYIKFEMFLFNYGHDRGTTQTLSFSFSGNNGAAVTIPLTLSIDSAEVRNSFIPIFRTDSSLASDPRELLCFTTSSAFLGEGSFDTRTRVFSYAAAAPINYILLSWSGGATGFIPSSNVTLLGYYI